MRRSFIPLLVILAGLPATTFARDPAVTPFDLVPPGDIVVPVAIDGQGPFRMLVDTGASRSAVTAALARRLQLRSVGETMMVTPARRQPRPLVLVKRLALGSGSSVSVPGLQLEDGDLAPGIDGLIGQDVLASRVYTIDYTAARIVWHTGAEVDPVGARLDMELDAGRLLVSLPQGSDTAPVAGGSILRLIPDSGADRLVLFTHADLATVTTGDVGVLKSVAGTRVIQEVRVSDLDVGAIRLRDQSAALLESTAADMPMGDGLLPLHLFSRVTINAPGRYLVVQK